MLIERKEKEADFQSTDVKDCDRSKVEDRSAKHRALQHQAHALLRAFFPLKFFVDRSVYLPCRPAVSLGLETG